MGSRRIIVCIDGPTYGRLEKAMKRHGLVKVQQMILAYCRLKLNEEEAWTK